MTIEVIKQIRLAEEDASQLQRDAAAKSRRIVAQAREDGAAAVREITRQASEEAAAMIARVEKQAEADAQVILGGADQDCAKLKGEVASRMDKAVGIIVGRIVNG